MLERVLEALERHLVDLLAVPPEPDASAGSEGSLRVFRAAPAYYRLQLLALALRQLVLLAVIAGVTMAIIVGLHAAELGGTGALVAVAVVALLLFSALAIFNYLVVRLDYRMRWYKVTDRSLRIREGIIHVREMTMTFANIQNISISQGPLQRLFGIADLQVQSAGGGAVAPQPGAGFGMHVGMFRGVDDAEAIRNLMLARLRGLRDAGLGDGDDHDTTVDEGAGGEHELLAVLAAVRDEARAMHQAAARRAGAGA
ncbi:MAG: PH domain-containing protein [Myxococcales bacterium]|nr:PH domain-containing protein [Myxococcales bacterium]